jgi:hypothetical protein
MESAMSEMQRASSAMTAQLGSLSSK